MSDTAANHAVIRDAFCAAEFVPPSKTDALRHLRGCRTPLPRGRWGLAIIDPQRLFCDPTSPAFIPDWTEAEPRAAALALAFGWRNLPVVVTRHVVDPKDRAGVFGHFFPNHRIGADEQWSELAESVHYWTSGHVLYQKSGHDSFREGLPACLAGCAAVALCGVRTDLCVLATAIDLARHGVIPIVAADACAARDLSGHQAALRVLAEGHAHVVDTAELVAYLDRLRDARDMRP